MLSEEAILARNKKTYTYEDYAQLPEGAPYQLINGKLVMSPAPIPYHQQISKNLMYWICDYVEIKKQLGIALDAPIDVYFGEKETYQPDIIYISNERKHIIGEKKIEGAPDWVIEILSETTAHYDLGYKKTIYAQKGVKEYWAVHPEEKSIEQFILKNSKFTLSNVHDQKDSIAPVSVPGLVIPLEKVFKK